MAIEVLSNDGGQMQNPLAVVAVSFDFNLRPSRVWIEAFGEKTPCQFLWNGRLGNRAGGSARRESPSVRALGEDPLAAALPRNLH